MTLEDAKGLYMCRYARDFQVSHRRSGSSVMVYGTDGFESLSRGDLLNNSCKDGKEAGLDGGGS